MRTHYSPSPIREIRAASQTNRPRDFKPAGFWYSVDGDWERWCNDEGTDFIRGKLLYEVELGAERLLKLTSAEEIMQFHENYAIRERSHRRFDYPDWTRLAAEYDGLEIAPYCWELRLDLSWYYPWDCASGVIWQPRGMSVKVLTEQPSQA